MRLSCTIRAHPRREPLVNRLENRLSLGWDRYTGNPLNPLVQVAWDRDNNSWETGRRSWLAHDTDSDWHLVIEDDALVCNDLLPGVAKALEDLPIESVASLYLGNQGHGGLARAIPNHGHTWICGPGLIWGVAIAVPTATIPDMIAVCDRMPFPDRVYDARLAQFYRDVLGWPAYFTWPSLTDHADVESLLGSNPGRYALGFIGEDASALHDFHPAGQVTTLSTGPITTPIGIPMADLLIAKTTASFEFNGDITFVNKGITTAEADADIVKAYPQLWEPIRVTYPARKAAKKSAAKKSAKVEDHTADPGSKRDV